MIIPLEDGSETWKVDVSIAGSEGRMLIWFDLWNENEGSGGKKRVSMRASFNRKIRFSIIQRGASFSSPKGAARPIFEEKSAEEWFPLLFLFLLLSLSPLDLRLEIFISIASYSFPHFFDLESRKVVEIFGQ